jgi:hypothetical protein
MGVQIVFPGENQKVLIEVSGFERPSADNEADANWLASFLTVKAGPFSGTMRLAFMTHDLTVLRDRLKQALASQSGAVAFENTDGELSLAVDFNERGGASIKGVARTHGPLGAALHFQFETDQSALTQTLYQLEDALRAFPVRRRSQVSDREKASSTDPY